MAFPASQQTVEDALKNIRSTAIRARDESQSLSDRSAAGNVPRADFITLQRRLQHAINIWDANQAVPGLVQYARDQYDDQALNIGTEYTAMRAAAISLRDWVFNNIPTDSGSGAVLLETIDNAGVSTAIQVTPGQSATFRTEVAAFVATVS